MPRELPKTYTYCDDCWHVMDDCKCGEPRCEGCNKYADTYYRIEDEYYCVACCKKHYPEVHKEWMEE